MVYTIEFAESVKEHLKKLAANQRAIMLGAIQKQLMHEPLKETRNRKHLSPNPIAPWEIRKGNLRVFYDVADKESKVVRILAIGRKEKNKLFIGNKEVKL
ncbi:MAG: type II toxin-antitoxin system RelE/ParE family toxin [Candidatus Cloacimonadota bacterium]|nr:type II toxin-antitoxin system RelE/ParE family toxin [Candidatus Cloacimonadota bacterium]